MYQEKKSSRHQGLGEFFYYRRNKKVEENEEEGGRERKEKEEEGKGMKKKRKKRRRNRAHRYPVKHRDGSELKHSLTKRKKFLLPTLDSPLTLQGPVPGIVSSSCLWSVTDNSRSKEGF